MQRPESAPHFFFSNVREAKEKDSSSLCHWLFWSLFEWVRAVNESLNWGGTLRHTAIADTKKSYYGLIMEWLKWNNTSMSEAPCPHKWSNAWLSGIWINKRARAGHVIIGCNTTGRYAPYSCNKGGGLIERTKYGKEAGGMTWAHMFWKAASSKECERP